MVKSQAHFRLEESLIESVKIRAKEEGVTVTDLVVRFLQQGLGLNTHTNTHSINGKELEDAIYKRIHEQLNNELSELEKRISENILEIENKWENRLSNFTPPKSIDSTKTPIIKDIDSKLETKTEESNTPIRVPEKYTESSNNPTLFTTIINEQIMIPAKLGHFLNEKTNSSDWDIHKLKNIRAKQLTWIKNYDNPTKHKRKSPLPLVVENYLIDWEISDYDKDTSSGKKWWVKELPSDEIERQKIIDERLQKYKSHYKLN
jgi:hypothetical protein